MDGRLRHPARVVPLVFLIAALIGTAVLMLPISREGTDSPDPVAALFTAVSAVCITGLTVVDTESYWSGFGEAVILSLIQLGGFGIMTMASLLAMLVAGRLRLKDRLAAAAETKMLGLGGVRKLVVRVAAITVAVELVMAVILTLRFYAGYGFSFSKALRFGVFHAVSAFNNAGFALFPDSLESFATDPLVTLPLALAVIIGGIGSPVIAELVRKTRRPASWSVHTKLTLLGTAILIAVGFLVYLIFEWNATMGPLGVFDKVVTAFVSSVMPRSAGFNALPMAEVAPETSAVTMVLMFIGGGSAGTSGGIKVTTFLLLAFVIWAEVRGEPEVSVFRRTIAPTVQRQAVAVALLGVGVVAVSTVVLQSVSGLPLGTVLFDTISAFGPVGLSNGTVQELSTAGQLIIVALMYTGRVGVIAVAAALALRDRGRRFRYPEERPIVG
ncbi:MAG: TrkH family potassium uptake protein [Stackebrandtia sp.]